MSDPAKLVDDLLKIILDKWPTAVIKQNPIRMTSNPNYEIWFGQSYYVRIFLTSICDICFYKYFPDGCFRPELGMLELADESREYGNYMTPNHFFQRINEIMTNHK